MLKKNRIQVTDDETKQSPLLPLKPQNLPTSNIYDGIVKYYAANAEWAIFIDGWMRWLASPSAWQDETDESGHKITQITEFILGVDVELDCNDVENCLESSAIIAAIQAAIAENTGDIATNTSNIADNAAEIASNDTDIASLQAQVTSNDGDIASLQAQVNNNIIAIADHENRLDQAEISIIQHNLTLNDHETRIDALEAASGGGGSGTGVSMIVKRLIETVHVDADTASFDVSMPTGYDHVTMEFFGRGSGASDDQLLIRYNADFTSSNYQFQRAATAANQPWIGLLAPSNAVFKGSCIIEFHNLQQAVRRAATGLSHTNSGTASATGRAEFFGHVWENDAEITNVRFSGNTVDIEAGSFVNVYVHEERTVLIGDEFDWTMTFDFSIDDYSEVFDLVVGVYSGGEYRNDVSDLDYVRIDLPATGVLSGDLNIQQAEYTYFLDDVPDTDDNLYFNPNGIVATVQPTPTHGSEAVWTFDDGDKVANGFSFSVSADDFSSTGAYAALRKLVLRGSGTVPSELESYVD